MAELAKCPMPNCGGFPEQRYGGVAYYVRCRKCGMGGPKNSEGHELAAEAWNSLCEKIRVGDAAMKDMPEDMFIDPTREITTRQYPHSVAIDVTFPLRPKSMPIPAPPSKDDVLRELLFKCYKILGEQYRGYATEPPIMDEIDAALGAEQ